MKIDLNSSPNKPLFLHVISTSLMKTLWNKEKLLVTEQFLLFPQLSSAESFNLEESEICRLGKGYVYDSLLCTMDFGDLFSPLLPEHGSTVFSLIDTLPTLLDFIW